MEATHDELMMPREAAALIGVTTTTLRFYARLGDLPPAAEVKGRMRLYRRSDVEAFIERRAAQADQGA